MMDNSIDPLALVGKIKPNLFPMQAPLVTSKSIDLESYGLKPGEENAPTFSDAMTKASQQVSRATPSGSPPPGSPPSPSSTDQKIGALRSVSKIYEGLAFIPQDILARVDQLKDKANFEKTTDPHYVYLPDLIPKNPSRLDDASLESQVYDKAFLKWAEENPGERATSPHNLNMLHGMDTNPFKDGDAMNFSLFQSSPYFKALHTQSMTPRNIIQKLDPTFWDSINQTIDAIAKTDYATLTPVELRELKNPYGNARPGLAIQNVADPFTDSGTDSFDIRANFNGVLESNVWKNWDTKTSFRFLNRLWEASTRVDDVLRELFGKASNMPTATFEASLVGKTDQASIQALQTAKQGVTTRLTQWWDTVGTHLDESTLLPFGLLSSLAPLMAATKDLGNWSDRQGASPMGDSLGFQGKMIADYLSQIQTTYLNQTFKVADGLGAKDFPLGSDATIQDVMAQLRKEGVLDPQGRIIYKGDLDTLSLNSVLTSKTDIEQVKNVLRERQIGRFSLEVQDQTLVAGRRRQMVQLKTTNGAYMTLPDLLAQLEVPTQPKAQIETAQMVYSTLLSLYQSLSGISDTRDSNGQLPIQSKGSISTLLATQNAKWQEWDDQSGNWVSQSGPYRMSFKTPSQATEFGNQIRIIIALLEPVVGLFGQRFDEKGKPIFKQLVDNSGTSSTKELITADSKGYRLGVDAVYDRSVFETGFWKDAATQLEKKVIGRLAEGMFTRSLTNRQERSTHRTKKKAYDEAVEEVKEEEANRLINDMKQRMKARQEEQAQQAARNAQLAELKRDEARRQAIQKQTQTNKKK